MATAGGLDESVSILCESASVLRIVGCKLTCCLQAFAAQFYGLFDPPHFEGSHFFDDCVAEVYFSQSQNTEKIVGVEAVVYEYCVACQLIPPPSPPSQSLPPLPPNPFLPSLPIPSSQLFPNITLRTTPHICGTPLYHMTEHHLTLHQNLNIAPFLCSSF